MRSPLYPLQSGYLGWTQYFKTRKAFINVFPSTDKFDHKTKFNPPVQTTELKVEYIWNLINKTYKHNAYRIYTFDYRIGKNFETDYEKFFADADKLVKSHDFVYIYTENPDHLLHEHGIESEVVKDNMIYLNNKLEELVKNNPDTLFLLTADHGFKNVKEINIKNFPDFLETLEYKNYSIEGRFATFFVKNEKKFLELSKKYFGNDFEIYSKKEIFENNIFGYGTPRENVEYNIGDYTLLATGDISLYDYLVQFVKTNGKQEAGVYSFNLFEDRDALKVNEFHLCNLVYDDNAQELRFEVILRTTEDTFCMVEYEGKRELTYLWSDSIGTLICPSDFKDYSKYSFIHTSYTPAYTEYITSYSEDLSRTVCNIIRSGNQYDVDIIESDADFNAVVAGMNVGAMRKDLEIKTSKIQIHNICVAFANNKSKIFNGNDYAYYENEIPDFFAFFSK